MKKLIESNGSADKMESGQRRKICISESLLFLCPNIVIGLYFLLLVIPFAHAQGNASASGVNSFYANEQISFFELEHETALNDKSPSYSAKENNIKNRFIVAEDDSGSDTSFTGVQSDRWQFAVIPYLWLMGINGDTTINGRSAKLDVSFGDIWDNLDFAAGVHLEAWRDRYGFLSTPVSPRLH